MSRILVTTAALLALVAGALLLAPFTPAVHAQEETMTAKLQKLVAGLNDEQQAALFLFISGFKGGNGAAAPAAAAAAAEETPQQAMEAGIAKLKDAAAKDDVEGILSFVSESFNHPQVGGKAELRDFLKNVVSMGYLKTYAPDTEISLKDADYEIKGDTASVYPIDIEGSFGSATIEIIAKKEGGKWMVSGIDISGI